MKTREHTQKNGFALPAAILALLVIGAIVTGGFYAASQEDRISASTNRGSDAFYIAEQGLHTFLGSKNGTYFDNLGTADTIGPTSVSFGDRTVGEYIVTVRRLEGDMFFVSSEGLVKRGTDTLATRRVGSISRIARIVLPTNGALSIYGGLTAGGNSQISGGDAGGPGCTAGDSVAGVVAHPDATVDEGNRDRIQGSPEVETDADLDTAMLTDYGAMDLDDLISLADKSFTGSGNGLRNMGPSTNQDGTCNTADTLNWGDPTQNGGACDDYFPIIHVDNSSGNTPFQLTTGSGQGILIVEGDMKLSGNMDFYGIVIVTGNIETTGTGNHMEGTVISLGSGELNSTNTTRGNSLIQYSKCRIDKVISDKARPLPIDKRSWVDLTAAKSG